MLLGLSEDWGVLENDLSKKISQISQLFRSFVDNLYLDCLIGNWIEDVDQEEDSVFEKLELLFLELIGVENSDYRSMYVLDHSNE